MTSEIIKPDSYYAYITVIKLTSKCARIFIELFEMLTPSSYSDGKNLAADIPNDPAQEIGTLQTTAFIGNIMKRKLLNLSTCVLNVCSHKYCGEVERPLPQQFIIPTIGSVFMTPHWKNSAFPADDLKMVNLRWLVQLRGCRLKSIYSLCDLMNAKIMQGKWLSFKNETSWKQCIKSPIFMCLCKWWKTLRRTN